MLANDLTLNPGSYGGTSANLVFVLTGYPTASSSLRRVQATALSEPNSLLISHQMAVKRGALTINRHLIRRDRTLIDPILGAVKASAWMTIEVPNGTSVFTGSVIKDLIGHVPATYMVAGATDAILAGES